MKRILFTIAVIAITLCFSFSTAYTKKHVEERCFDNQTSMRAAKDAREAQLQNNLVDIVEEWQEPPCAECIPLYCYRITWYE